MIVRRRKKRIAVDTETTGLSRWTGCRPFAVSMCDEDGVEHYWQWIVDPKTRMPCVPEKDRREVQAIVGDESIAKTFANAHFDVGMLESVGITVRGEIHDVLWMARAVSNLEYTFQLKPLAKKYVGIDDADEKALHAATVACRRAAKKLGWKIGDEVEQDYWLAHTLAALAPESLPDEVDVEACKKYAMMDAQRTIVLDGFYQVGMREAGVEKVYEGERRLFPVTKQMIDRGVRVDEDRLRDCEHQSQMKIDAAMAKLKKAYKGEFNVNSPTQVVELLFGGRPLKLPVLHRTPTNKPQTGGEALVPHLGNELVQALVSARANQKALTTFFQKYRAIAVREDDGLILHPGFRQWGTETARYSCGDPNLQAVSNPETTSSRTAQFVVDVRQVFTPRPGYVWYCPDYSQVEVIIFADISQEPTLLQAIRDKVDIHEATTNKVWGGEGNPRTKPRVEVLLANAESIDKAKDVLKVSGRSVTLGYLVDGLVEKFAWRIADLEKALDKKIHRKLAKAVTFTKIFGGGPNALMSWINVGRSEAETILRAYEDSFPTMMDRMAEIERQGREQGYMVGPFGDRLEVDRWASYQIVNHMVQNAAARLTKRGMVNCHEYLEGTGLDARIALTIHDELIFEIRKEHAFKKLLREICRLMSDHGGVFSVPTPVDIDRCDERWSKKSKVVL